MLFYSDLAYSLVQSILRNDAVHSNEPILISMNTKAINND